jgi:hypothetical protein
MPYAKIFSENNLLYFHLTKALRNAGCDIHVTDTPNYIFAILTRSNFKNTLPEIEKQTRNKFIKTVIILNINDIFLKKEITKRNINAYLVFVGDLYDDEKRQIDKKILKNINEKICLSGASAVSAEIIKNLFSFGFPSKEILIATKLKEVNFPKDIYLINLNDDIQDIIKRSNDADARVKHLKTPTSKKLFYKSIIFGSLLSLWIIVIPFIWVMLSSIFLLLSFSSLKDGHLTISKTFNNASLNMLDMGQDEFFTLSTIPIIGKSFDNALTISQFLSRAANLEKSAIDLYDQSNSLVRLVITDEKNDLNRISKNMTLDFDNLYKEVNFLQSEGVKLPFIREKINKNNQFLKDIKNYLAAGRALSSNLPALLGQDKKVTYLILFQNNTELRPTGGFIGSFSLVTLDKGKLIDNPVYDVYDADGQLKGHVEPPPQIKNYLGEANWYLRDSNWDPDWGVSADRARWFIEKEINREVDGVIGIDLEFAKGLLKVTGPINLPDLGLAVDDKNMYEKIQYEIESNFFPGSRKKANLLKGLSQGLIERLKTIKDSQKKEVLLSIFKNFQERHIQIELGNSDAQKTLEKINWSGSLNPKDCEEFNCQPINLALIEANLGVNKVNYYIKREMNLEIKIDDGVIYNRLLINYINHSKTAYYKNYLRLFTDKNTSQSTIGDGILVNIPPDENKLVEIKWQQPFEADLKNHGNISIYWRKQAGTLSDPISIKLNSSSLTGDGPITYNTTLTKDLIWKHPF